MVSIISHVDFDERDPDDVMKYSLDPSIFLTFDTQIKNNINLFFTKSKVLLDDSPWKMFDIFTKSFDIFEYVKYYSYTEPVYNRYNEQTLLKDRTYASIYLRSDNITRNYTRRTYSLLEFFGDLGGIFELVWLIFGLFMGKLVERKFNSKLAEKLYKVQKYSVD